MSEQDATSMTVPDLAVLGCGPTGLAALHEARQLGLSAVGFEAGDAPLPSIRRHMDGLVYASPALHYEVGGIPLDCDAINQCTREDLLHYYTRIIQLDRLRINYSHKVVALLPESDSVVTVFQTPEGVRRFRSRKVLVSCWLEPTPPPPAFLKQDRIEIKSHIANASEVANRRVVVIGGGLTAMEAAAAIMTTGQPVVLVARGKFFGSTLPRLHALIESTGSRVLENSEVLRTEDGQLIVRRDDEELRITSDVVIFSIGARLSPSIRRIVIKAGAIGTEEMARLSALTSARIDAARAKNQSSYSVPFETVTEACKDRIPDLSRQLFEGVRGIHFIGAILHTASGQAHVAPSIHTATLAVRAIAGAPPPSGFEGPLLRSISRWWSSWKPRLTPPFTTIESLRPLKIVSASRLWSPFLIELNASVKAATEWSARLSPEILKQIRPELRQAIHDIIEGADGTQTVRQICAAQGAKSQQERATLATFLCLLWRNGALTWLPPRTSAAPEQAGWTRNCAA
jgi:thioredoxin reductase